MHAAAETDDSIMASPSNVTCLLADDHPAILDSIGAYLCDEGITIVGRARTAGEALRAIEQRCAAVAVVDLRLPDMSGIEVARQACRVAPDTATLLYTGYFDSTLVHEALDAGARGVVLKEAPLADLSRAISRVAEGGTYLDPLLAGALVGADSAQLHLTPRERDVLRLLADGHTNEEIGAQLFLSPETIRTHVHKAVGRLGVRNRTQAVALALRQGLIA